MDINTCLATTADVRSLSLYAHLAPALTSLVLGWFVYRNSLTKSKAILFFLFTVFFALWLFGDLVLWNTNNYFFIAGIWSILDYINIIFFGLLFYFVYVDFSRRNKFSYVIVGLFILTSLFPFTLTILGLSTTEFQHSVCEMGENELISDYKIMYEIVVIVLVLLMYLAKLVFNAKEKGEKTRISLIAFSILLFMGTFAGTEYVASFTNVYEINLYALFTLPIFILVLTYVSTEGSTFRFKIDSLSFVKLLFVILVIISTLNLFLINSLIEFGVSVLTTIITIGSGILLFRGAQREAKQRVEIETLAQKLQKANDQLKILDKMKSEFVSIASHQLRSPLTAIRGYASMLLEGSYDKLPEKAVEAVNRISESGRYMALSIEDYLNVSRIESGNMKYEITEFNLPEQAEKVVGEVRPAADKKGLQIEYQSLCKGNCKIKADIGKTRQVLHNLIDNAMKYTPEGKVTVTVHDDSAKGTVGVSIKDTGVGMSVETQHDIFDKFVRAKNANNINVTGTGLGLFVAKKMIESMGGKIWAESEGEGKGSTFHFEFPMVK